MRKFYFSRPLFFGGITREPGFDEVTLGSERFLLKPYGKKPFSYVLVNCKELLLAGHPIC